MGGAVDYFNHISRAGHDLWDGEEEVYLTGHLTDLIKERAVSFVRKPREKPFLLSLHLNAPHWPWETRNDKEEADRNQEKIAHLDGGSVKIYFQMIREVDEGIGRVLAALDEVGARDHMLVVFTSDNGGERFSDMWPLSGKKMTSSKAASACPASSAGRIACRRAKPTDQLATTMDWVATFLSAAGVSPHPDYPLDGIGLFGEPVERNLYWRMTHREQKAVRSGCGSIFPLRAASSYTTYGTTAGSGPTCAAATRRGSRNCGPILKSGTPPCRRSLPSTSSTPIRRWRDPAVRRGGP